MSTIFGSRAASPFQAPAQPAPPTSLGKTMAAALIEAEQSKATPWEVKQDLNKRLPSIVAEITGMPLERAKAHFNDIEKLAHMTVFTVGGKDYLPAIVARLEEHQWSDVLSPAGRQGILVQQGVAIARKPTELAGSDISISVVAQRYEDDDAKQPEERLAISTLYTIREFRDRDLPFRGGFAYWALVDQKQAVRYDRLLAAERALSMALVHYQTIDNPQKRNDGVLLPRVIKALEALSAYAPKGRELQDSSRSAMTDTVVTVRDLQILAATATFTMFPFGPVAGTTAGTGVAAFTRELDRHLPGPRFFPEPDSITPVLRDGINVLGTLGGVYAGPLALKLGTALFPGGGPKVQMGLHFILHMLADGSSEALREIVDGLAVGLSWDEIIKNALDAVVGGSGASILSSIGKIALKKTPMSAQQIEVLTESLERVVTRLGANAGSDFFIRLFSDSISGIDRLISDAPAHLSALQSRASRVMSGEWLNEISSELTVFDLHFLEVELGWSTAGVQLHPASGFLRQLQLAARRSDVVSPSGPRALASNGAAIANEEELWHALIVLLSRQQSAQQGIDLLQELLDAS